MRLSTAEVGPPLRELTPLTGEGLVLRVRHAFRSEARQVPGYVFDVTTTQGNAVGTATVLITNDLEAIRTTGHRSYRGVSQAGLCRQDRPSCVPALERPWRASCSAHF